MKKGLRLFAELVKTLLLAADLKLRPDEKGIETILIPSEKDLTGLYLKLRPDEKGIETS